MAAQSFCCGCQLCFVPPNFHPWFRVTDSVSDKLHLSFTHFIVSITQSHAKYSVLYAKVWTWGESSEGNTSSSGANSEHHVTCFIFATRALITPICMINFPDPWQTENDLVSCQPTSIWSQRGNYYSLLLNGCPPTIIPLKRHPFCLTKNPISIIWCKQSTIEARMQQQLYLKTINYCLWMEKA